MEGTRATILVNHGQFLNISNKIFLVVLGVLCLSGTFIGCSPETSNKLPADESKQLDPTPTQPPMESTSTPKTENTPLKIADGSKARYRIGEQLARLDTPITAVGETSDVSGQLILDGSGNVVAGSTITVDITTLRSDEAKRDRWVRKNGGLGENVVFTVETISNLPWPLPNEGKARIELEGNLLIAGISKATKWDSSINFHAAGLSGLAVTEIGWEEFSLPKPNMFFIVSVDDRFRLEIEFEVEYH